MKKVPSPPNLSRSALLDESLHSKLKRQLPSTRPKQLKPKQRAPQKSGLPQASRSGALSD